MSTGTVSGSISAEEMIDPAALRQEQLLGRLDAIAESQGKLLAALHETQQGILELTDAIKAAFKEQRAALNELGARTGDILAMVNTLDFAVRKTKPPRKRRRK